MSDQRGVTVTEMLVALMVLTFGALATYQLFSVSAVTAAYAANRVTAQQIASAELEAVRALPYAAIAMTSTDVDDTRFDSLALVQPTAAARVQPRSTVSRNGIDFTVWRKVGWKPVVVRGVTYSNTIKMVSIVVAWVDRSGAQQRSLSGAVTRAQTSD